MPRLALLLPFALGLLVAAPALHTPAAAAQPPHAPAVLAWAEAVNVAEVAEGAAGVPGVAPAPALEDDDWGAPQASGAAAAAATLLPIDPVSPPVAPLLPRRPPRVPMRN